ncbi:MAG TPA: toxin-antitoxin system HicB family antitoxin [Dehalococcoidia bacterium]|nr:toxin-antitoxin system HicB family antitoxin [Dehalococcoidia bacterium]
MTQAQRQQREIDLSAVFQALERPLALIDSPERRADMQRYVEAARIHLERAIFDILSDVATTVSEAGVGASVRLEYQGGKLYLVVEGASEAEAGPETERLFSAEGDIEKVTIRLPAELKELIAQAANLRGMSVNTWYVRELARTISRQVRDEIRDQRRESRREERRNRGLRGFVGRD